MVALVAPLALAACGGGGGGGQTTTAGGDPLAAAAEATLKQPSEQVGVDAMVDLAGQPLSLDGSGGFDNQSGSGKLGLKVSLGSLGSTNVDEVFRKRVIWLRSPLLASTLRGKHWLRVDAGKEANALGFDLRALAGQTPSDALSTFRLGGKVTTEGSEKIDGVDTTHYRKTFSRGGTENAYTSVDAWVDEKNLVRKLELDYTAKVDPTSKEGAHTLLTMTFSNFGSPVSVTIPPAGDSIDSSELGK
jgi:hypothetical protein